MKVTSVASSGDIRYLGAGSYTTVSTGTYEDAGNFSTTGDIGNSMLVIEMAFHKVSGVSSAGKIGINNQSGNNAEYATSTGAGGCLRATMWKASTATNYVGGVMMTSNSISYNSSNTYDLSAAETIYIKAYADTGCVYFVRWIAYLVGSGVK